MAKVQHVDAKFYLKDVPVENAQTVSDTKQQLKQKENKVAFKEEEKITKGLNDLTLLLTSLEGSKISKPKL